MNNSPDFQNAFQTSAAAKPGSRKSLFNWAASWMAITALATPGMVSVAHAQELDNNARAAAIVIDAQSGEVLYARRADSARYPASITKIMTLYLAFEALASGQIKSTDQMMMSRHANSQAPVKIGFRDGDTISVDAAMRLTALYSANDLAVGLAEKIAGSEEKFSALMTIRAQELGMTSTRFVNANGLPDERQLSSARDLAILMRAIMRDYPQYYSYLNVRAYDYNGRTYYNHNPLRDLNGVDGGKTGFTRAAGYNLVVSQAKNGHRLIAVMLGSSNKDARRETLTSIMESGFDVIERREKGERILVAQNEINQGLEHRITTTGPQPYTVLASNTPMNESQLRGALASSEEANAEEDGERVSATITAPDVVRTLSGSAPAPYPYAAAVPLPTPAAPSAAAEPTPISVAASTARPYLPTPEKASISQMPSSVLAETNRAKLDKAAEKASDAGCVAPAKASASKAKTGKAKATKVSASAKSKLSATKASLAKCKTKKDPTAIWAIQVGAFKQKTQANEWALSLKKRFKPQLAKNETNVSKNEHGWYRTRFVEMTELQAKAACKAIDAKRLDCVIVKPEA